MPEMSVSGRPRELSTQHSAYAQPLREVTQDALTLDMLTSHKVINVRENSMVVLRTWEDISTT